jgi:hypothetical protein
MEESLLNVLDLRQIINSSQVETIHVRQNDKVMYMVFEQDIK